MHVPPLYTYRLHFYPTIFLFLLSGIYSCQARKNITVDSNSPLIRYSPASSWRKIAGDLDAGGEHMMTQDRGAYALINLTFVSYWTLSAKWPYRVITQHSIDGNQTFVIDLQDHSVPVLGGGSASHRSSIVSRFIGSSELRHTIRISVPPRERYAVIDRLIFEVDDNNTFAPSSTSMSSQIPISAPLSTRVLASSSTSITATSASFSPGELSSMDKERKLTIILGILGPFLALFCVLLLVYLYYRHRTKTSRLEVEGTAPMPSKDWVENYKLWRPPGATTDVDVTHTPVTYTPPLQGASEWPGNPTVTHPGSPSIPFSPERMIRTRTHRPRPF